MAQRAQEGCGRDQPSLQKTGELRRSVGRAGDADFFSWSVGSSFPEICMSSGLLLIQAALHNVQASPGVAWESPLTGIPRFSVRDGGLWDTGLAVRILLGGELGSDGAFGKNCG